MTWDVSPPAQGASAQSGYLPQSRGPLLTHLLILTDGNFLHTNRNSHSGDQKTKKLQSRTVKPEPAVGQEAGFWRDLHGWGSGPQAAPAGGREEQLRTSSRASWGPLSEARFFSSLSATNWSTERLTREMLLNLAHVSDLTLVLPDKCFIWRVWACLLLLCW